MKVKYYDIQPSEAMESEIACEYCVELNELLQTADVVSLHVPLLPSTTHLINENNLKQMKSSAYLINTSSGPVIDEAALVTALQNKTIKGAGLDVFENEPVLKPGLTDLENVVITPHIASASEETRGRMSELVAININEFFLGEERQINYKY